MMFEVIDMVYTKEEGNVVFRGTEEECHDWIQQCSGDDIFTYKVVPVID